MTNSKTKEDLNNNYLTKRQIMDMYGVVRSTAERYIKNSNISDKFVFKNKVYVNKLEFMQYIKELNQYE